jgi:hypothetical protein
MTQDLTARAAALAPRLERIARETGREVIDVVRRLTERIESNIKS